MDLCALVRVKLIHLNPCSSYRGHGFIMRTACIRDTRVSSGLSVLLFTCVREEGRRSYVRVCLHACVCVRALIRCGVRGIFSVSRLKDTRAALQPHAHQAVMTAPQHTHTAIMESVDRRVINCSSIETNDGAHWRDIVVVYCLNAWRLCIMHMSVCVFV